jgi:outer membrane autotransporter protein
VTGNLVQSGSGVYVVNVDHASISTDRVDVSGTTQLAGKAQVVDLNGGYVTPGAHQMTILTSAGGITDAGLTLETGSSAMVAYQLVHPDSTQLALAYQVDFAPTGLNGNEAALSDYLARAQLAGGSTGLAPVVTALFSQPDVRSLAAAYERLSPEPYLAIGTGTLFANLAFSDRLHSCGVRDGPDRFIREGECDWLQATSGELRRSRTDANLGSTHKSSGVAAGVQRAIGDGSWHLGLGLAYEHSTDAVDDLANTSGDSGQLGVVLKKSLGATSLAVDLTAGYGSYTTDRHVNLPLPGLTAKSSQEARFVAAHFRVAHAYEQPGNWYVKPSVDFGLAHAWFPGFEESGAAGADLHVQSHQEHHAMLTPAVEIGGETVLDGGQLLRPYARFGITRFLAGTSATIMTSFRDAPPGVAPFTVRSDLDNTFANLDLGVSIVGTKGTIVRIGYVGKFSQHVISNGAMAKLMIPF